MQSAFAQSAQWPLPLPSQLLVHLECHGAIDRGKGSIEFDQCFAEIPLPERHFIAIHVPIMDGQGQRPVFNPRFFESRDHWCERFGGAQQERAVTNGPRMNLKHVVCLNFKSTCSHRGQISEFQYVATA
ncbi:MAG TPA: hypothetical protein VGI40_09515 [Pirellulaceae bacterium]|jgi:hypothetical protein